MKLTRILPLIISIMLFGATATLTKAQQRTDSVQDSKTTALAQNGDAETVYNQRLLKVLDALEKAESLIQVLENEIEARKRLETINNQIIEAKDTQIAEQKKLIAILEKQSQRKLSILWGIVKVRF
jgi:parvulin-like peptidyl-prolyl isomerase